MSESTQQKLPVRDHGQLTGLADDDHTQYHTDARALTWLNTRSTTDLPEGANLYYTTARARSAISATSPVTYNSTTGAIGFDTGTTTLTAYVLKTGDTMTGGLVADMSADTAPMVIEVGGTSTSIKSLDLKDSSSNSWWYVRKRLLSDANYGFELNFNTTGSGGTFRAGQVITLNPGYTGSEFTSALSFDNAVAGTATYYLADATTYGMRGGFNRGGGGYSRGVTVGHNCGWLMLAGGGAVNYGSWSAATITKASGINVGLFASGLNGSLTSPSYIGAYITNYNANAAPPNMTGVKTALLVDNQALTSDIALFRDNGVACWTIPDGGNLTAGEGINMVFGTSTGTKIGTATTQKIGFWNVTPIVQPSAYTQTYTTADKTIAAYTPDDESGAYTGIDNAQAGTVYAQLTDLNALRAAYETLRAHAEDIGKGLNSVIDDLQAIGLVA